MARSQEKAQATLNRWLALKEGKVSGVSSVAARRPAVTSEVLNVSDCERYRHQCLREISRKLSEIQNGSLGEHVIRELNDKINALLREKRRWEMQIKSLGGPNYLANANAHLIQSGNKNQSGKTIRKNDLMYDLDGKAAWNANGYYYFGAAKELSGVREMFETLSSESSQHAKKSRHDLYESINGFYYGFYEDDLDQQDIIEEEQKREQQLRTIELQNFSIDREEKQKNGEFFLSDQELMEKEKIFHEKIRNENGMLDGIPKKEDIEKMILEKKKKEIREKFAKQKQQNTQNDAHMDVER